MKLAMPILIDAHQDLAYNMLTYQRDYLQPVAETRRREQDSPNRAANGDALLGWPEYQAGQVAVVFAVIFVEPRRYATKGFDSQAYRDLNEAGRLYRGQFDLYARLQDEHPDRFQIVATQPDLRRVLQAWEQQPADYPTLTHPVGLVLTVEGAEGIRDLGELEEWWQRGARILGPVWAGGRFCGGTFNPGGFTGEGFALLEAMAGLGFAMDITHMRENAARQALDAYPGPVLASHSNVRRLVQTDDNERQLSERVIRTLVERDAVIGVTPYNKYLVAGWQDGDRREPVSLTHLADHIDAICQVAGDAAHVGLGTDFDGGFGLQSVPREMNSIADLQKLGPVLAAKGYSPEEVEAILGQNWRKFLERILP